MRVSLRNSRSGQLTIAFAIGIAFGFLLQRGGVTNYDVILGQLLLEDFTVVKVMLSAVVVGMLGVHAMRSLGWVTLHPKPGSWTTSVIGGLLFGIGFGLLGYCPGTVVGAAAQGNLDALLGGIPGILLGAGLFAAAYPILKSRLLDKGTFARLTLPELLGLNCWALVLPVSAAIVLLLWWIELVSY